MTPDKVKEAVAECKRFIKRAEALLKVEYPAQYNPRESGACRRASMDLTRALADLRKTQ
jgi:hypothetical protein